MAVGVGSAGIVSRAAGLSLKLFGGLAFGMSRTADRLRLPYELTRKGAKNMKFMLMMNASKGDGDWGVSKWAPEDLKAHIGFMKKFTGALAESGELVGAEGLAMPAQAKLVRAGKD